MSVFFFSKRMLFLETTQPSTYIPGVSELFVSSQNTISSSRALSSWEDQLLSFLIYADMLLLAGSDNVHHHIEGSTLTLTLAQHNPQQRPQHQPLVTQRPRRHNTRDSGGSSSTSARSGVRELLLVSGPIAGKLARNTQQRIIRNTQHTCNMHHTL